MHKGRVMVPTKSHIPGPLLKEYHDSHQQVGMQAENLPTPSHIVVLGKDAERGGEVCSSMCNVPTTKGLQYAPSRVTAPPSYFSPSTG